MTTQPTNLDALHDLLRGILPADLPLILRTLQAGHARAPDGYSGLPRTHEELAEALRGLAIAGRVQERKRQWHWLPAKVEKRDEQKALWA